MEVRNRTALTVTVGLALAGLTAMAGGGAAAGAANAQPLVMAPAPYGSYTDNFNPFSSSANPGTVGFIYEPLFYFNTVGPQVYGLLGQSYQWSHANTVLTVHLRSGVKWTDGATFSSRDVVFTFDLLKANPALDTSGVWTKLRTVTAPNADTVVFTFNQADVPFALYVLETNIVPQHIWSKIASPAKYLNTHPVGTGPYELASFTSQGYKFTPNPHYYLGVPKVPEIEIPAYNANNSLNLALAQGEVQWSGQFMPSIQSLFVAKDPSHNHYWFPPYEMAAFYPNLKNPLLSQVVVRKAIALALNRVEMGTKGEYGYEKPASPTGLVFPQGRSWLDPALKNDANYTYSPAAAARLLQSAGFKKNGQGIFVSPKGQELSLTLQVVSGWSDWDADCAMAVSSLKQAGINVTVVEDTFGDYIANLKDGHFELAMSWTNVGPNPYYAYYNMLDPNGDWNLEGWNNPATNRALNSFASTTNHATQLEDMYTIEQQMVNDVPVIPVLDGALWYEYVDSSYTGWPTASNPYVTPAPYSWPAPEIVVMHLKPR
jgi:peptide/nickel transport system substrate-binding protein